MYEVKIALRNASIVSVVCETDEQRIACLETFKKAIADQESWVVWRDYFIVRVSDIAAICWDDVR